MNHSSKKRGEVKSKEEQAKEEAYAQQINAAWDQFIKVRKEWTKSDKSIDELLDYSAKVLALMSDTSSTINFRQDLLNAKFKDLVINLKEAVKQDAIRQKEQEGVEKDASLSNAEKPEEPKTEDKLQITEPQVSEKDKAMKALETLIKTEFEMLVGLAMKDPKSYQLWHHRKWMFLKIWELECLLGIKGVISKKCVQMDLKICDKFLTKDERNFHAWNYRCFLVNYLLERFPDEALAVIEKELDFLQSKLEANFSNYSAIHFKTKYMLRRETLLRPETFVGCEEDQVTLPLSTLAKEITFASEGLFIAPYEQSLWIYLGWLLDRKRIAAVQSADISADKKLILKIGNFAPQAASVASSLHIEDQEGQEVDYLVTEDAVEVLITSQEGQVTVRKRAGAERSFLMVPTTVRWAEGTVTDCQLVKDEGALKEISEVVALWDSVLASVKDICDSEPKNKEAGINYAELCCKYLAQKQPLASVVTFQTLDRQAVAQKLAALRQSSDGSLALLDLYSDKLEHSYLTN